MGVALLINNVTTFFQIVVIEEPVDNLYHVLAVGILHRLADGQHGLRLERNVLTVVNRQLKIYPCTDKLHHCVLSLEEFPVLDVAVLIQTVRLRGLLLSVHIAQEGVTVVDDCIIVTGLVEAVVVERRLV